MTAGVYTIMCTVTNRLYIGSTVNYSSRISRHKTALRKGIHSNYPLQDEWNKYGEKYFTFELFHEHLDNYERERCERNLIDNNANCYNLLRPARGSLSKWAPPPRPHQLMLDMEFTINSVSKFSACGHDKISENIYEDSRGYKTCRICRAEAVRRWERNHPEKTRAENAKRQRELRRRRKSRRLIQSE